MTVSATLIADSVAKTNNVRLTTFLLRYPRFIHSEVMTHRAFSRNASSSRAIPISRMIADVKADMAKPLEFRKKKKGMQAGDPFGPKGQWLCTKLWRTAGHLACLSAWLMEKLGVHKQYANRLIEPFAHITVVVTATEYANWFALRNHPAAQPEIKALAELMWNLWLHNEPHRLDADEWHLPFIPYHTIPKVSETMRQLYLADLIAKSVACCARTSYLNHDKTTSAIEADRSLHDKLVAEDPKHASPAEHQATPMSHEESFPDWERGDKTIPFSGNLRGWHQYRKQLPGENIETYAETPDYLKSRNPFDHHVPGNLVGTTRSRR